MQFCTHSNKVLGSVPFCVKQKVCLCDWQVKGRWVVRIETGRWQDGQAERRQIKRWLVHSQLSGCVLVHFQLSGCVSERRVFGFTLLSTCRSTGGPNRCHWSVHVYDTATWVFFLGITIKMLWHAAVTQHMRSKNLRKCLHLSYGAVFKQQIFNFFILI